MSLRKFPNTPRGLQTWRGGDFLERYWSKEFQLPSFWRLPQSVTSLTVTANKVALPKTRDIVAQLPNLDGLSLLGPHKAVAERALPGIGVTLRGRFGGQLRLVGPGYAGEGVMGIFLEVPTGSHFTEVQVRSTHDHLPP